MTVMAYYPGCSLLGSSREYGESLRAILPALGVELAEVPDWNCCGASSAHAIDRDLSLSLPARILSLAETLDADEMLVPCAACYNRLASARHELEDAATRERITGITGLGYKGSIRPLNILEFLSKHADILRNKTVKPFAHEVACYYGCLLVRPPKVTRFDRSEDPRSMDALMSAIGATPVEWAFKVECCGAGHSITRTDLVGKLSYRIIDNAVRHGAQAIIAACPMCHSNLDMRRSFINRAAGKKYSIPVLFITQAVGLAVGIDRKELGLHRHIVTVRFPDAKPGPEPKPRAAEAPQPAASE